LSAKSTLDLESKKVLTPVYNAYFGIKNKRDPSQDSLKKKSIGSMCMGIDLSQY